MIDDASSSNDDELAVLLSKAAAGDDAAFVKLTHPLWPRVTGFVKKRCPVQLRAHYEIDDVLQHILLDAFRRIGQFKPQGPDALLRWLLTLARNRMLALARMSGAEKRASDNKRVNLTDEASVARLLDELAVHRRTPSQSAARHEAVAALEGSLIRLPPDYQQVIQMRYVEGLSHQEIGQKMQRSEQAAKQLLHRAIQALRQEMGSASMYL